MKLLMISGDRSVLAGKRGAFWYTLEEFSKHWERIDVICPQQSQPLTLNPQPLFGNVYFHPSPHKLWYQPFWIQKCGARLIDEFRHDVMTVHDYPPFYNGIGARLLLRRHHLKSVLEIHHIVGWPMPASFIERIGYWLTRLVISGHTNHFDVVRTVSSSVKNQLVRLGVSSANISIVPSFYLDASVLKPAFEAEKKYDVVFCGRLTKNKGLSILIEALEDLPGKKLLVIGDGPERKRCEDQVRRSDMSDRVRFAGWLPDQLSVIRELRTARVFVLPSLSEGGPRIALEAMALGLPVIATRVGVLPDVIEDGTNGVFTTGEPEDLRTNIAALLLDGAKRTAIGQAGTKILLRFERTKLIREYAEFLKDVRC